MSSAVDHLNAREHQFRINALPDGLCIRQRIDRCHDSRCAAVVFLNIALPLGKSLHVSVTERAQYGKLAAVIWQSPRRRTCRGQKTAGIVALVDGAVVVIVVTAVFVVRVLVDVFSALPAGEMVIVPVKWTAYAFSPLCFDSLKSGNITSAELLYRNLQ